MLGGGTFTSQNKILPGAYVNFVSSARVMNNLSDRGVATMPLELDWGSDNKIIEVTQSDFIDNAVNLFGYGYTSEKLTALRELFKHATKAYIYKLTSGGEKASNLYATARCSGVRGNDLTVLVTNSVDDEEKYEVRLYLGSALMDVQTVDTAADLADNDFVVWKKNVELAETAGVKLEGGTNGIVTGASHQNYLDAIESYTFNTMGVCTMDNATKAFYVAFTKRMRDQAGIKFQCVLCQCAADTEGVINVKNSTEAVPWVTGLEAACAVNASCENTVYDGELDIDTSYTQAQLESAIKSGEFVLHSVGSEIRVLEDINSLVTLTDDKSDLFCSNQTIRVIDQIATDTATLFGGKYHGKILNNDSGRVSLWGDIVAHLKELEKLGAIENFSDQDVGVSAGTNKAGVSISVVVTVVNTMSQLYMTVTIQ